jgi:hypothetical protein
MLKPAPSVVVQLILRWASTTTHPVAGNVTVALLATSDVDPDAYTTDAMALLVVYVAVTAVPSGPKLDPKMPTTWFPPVNAFADPTPSNDEMMGGLYDVGPTVVAAVCPPTVTFQNRPGPTPGAVTHCSSDVDGVAEITLQFVAVYAAGAHAGPYTTLIRPSFTTAAVADAGPNSRPLITTICPPSVFAFRLPAPEMSSSVGDTNDVVCTDAALDCPPTVTVHRWLRPTPTAPKHDTHRCPTGSRVQLVAVRTRPSLAGGQERERERE